MTLPRFALIAAPLIAVAPLAAPTTSYACSGYSCANDQFLPRGGSVPANISAIAWTPGHSADATSTALPRFECAAADGSTHTVRFVALPEDKPDHLQLAESLTAGDHCVISSGVADCAIDDPAYDAASHTNGKAEFDVVEASDVPGELGVIAVTGAQLGEVDVAADASCSERIEACRVDASLDWNAATLPWKDALVFETFVDGERYATSRNLAIPDELGGLYSGRDHDVVFALLGDVPDNARVGRKLEAGEHSLVIKAHLPGSAQTLATPAVTIVLRCGGSSEPPLAANTIGGDSGGCVVAPAIGNAEGRRVPAFASALGALWMLLMAARRRQR
jgi:hypothetical protein